MAKPTYHRLDPAYAAHPAGLVESPILSETTDLIRKLGQHHRIVVATWDPDRSAFCRKAGTAKRNLSKAPVAKTSGGGGQALRSGLGQPCLEEFLPVVAARC